MALIVEDGTGLENADAYIDIAYLDTYLSSIGKSVTGSTEQKEQHIRNATNYITQRYFDMFDGYKRKETQALDFPREMLLVRDTYYEKYIRADIVPVQIKKATAELALRNHLKGDLMPDLKQGVVKKKIDVIEIEYDKNSSQLPRYSSIDRILAPLLKAGTSGQFRDIVRA